MPKKRKQHKQSFPWPFIVFGVLLVIAAAILFINRGEENGGGIPAIAVDTDLIDYGDVKLDESRAFSVAVSNTGNGTLRFQEKPYIEVREGC